MFIYPQLYEEKLFFHLPYQLMTEVYVCQTPHSSATGEAHGLFWSEKGEKEKKGERERKPFNTTFSEIQQNFSLHKYRKPCLPLGSGKGFERCL